MTDFLDQLAQSCTFSMLNGRLTQVDDQGVNAANGILLQPGSIVDSKYKIVGLIGQGGMGAIYKVHHLMLQKEMALKTFRSHGFSTDSWQRFQREAQAIARLDHENIVDVFDFGITQENLPYYTMELLTGHSLSDALHQSGRIAPAAALIIFRQVAAALAHAHRQNIVHRDIKPGNIFLIADRPGQGGLQRAKLVDFGIAKLAESTVPREELTLTRAGTIFGSPLYMSPEQSLSFPTDSRTDMYSFGCSLYHSLTGTPPFVGKTAFLTMTLHQNKKAPSLQDSGIDFVIPQRLENLIARLLAKKPEDRYENFDEIEAELRWCRRAVEAERPASVGVNTFTTKPTPGFVGEDDLEMQPKGPDKSNRMLAILVISALSLMMIAVFITLGIMQKTASDQSSQTAPAQRPNAKGSFLVESNGKEKIFLFPKNSPFGAFKYDGKTVDCSGIVTVPSNARILFIPDTDFLEHPEMFRRFGPNDLHGIQLNFYGVFWKDEHIEAISSLKGLRQLKLTSLKEVRPSTVYLIDKLENLKYLSLSNSEVQCEDLILSKVLPKVEFLRVSRLTNLPVLLNFLATHDVHTKVLVANSSDLSAADFLTITKIKSLIFFAGQANRITNGTMNKIEVAPSWQGLNLMSNPISDGAIDALSKFKDLQYINLDSTLFSKPGLKQLKAKLPPKCKILDVDGNKFEEVCRSILDPFE